jgi:hypothetical protein
MPHPAIRISLVNQNCEFKPGETIAGAVRLADAPIGSELIVELKWLTRGKGSVDQATVQTMSWPIGQTEGEVSFQFNAPREPLSFRGRLIAICWVVAARIRPKKAQAEVEIVISPTLAALYAW